MHLLFGGKLLKEKPEKDLHSAVIDQSVWSTDTHRGQLGKYKKPLNFCTENSSYLECHHKLCQTTSRKWRQSQEPSTVRSSVLVDTGVAVIRATTH